MTSNAVNSSARAARLLCLLTTLSALAGCGKTPIDAIVPDDAALPPGDVCSAGLPSVVPGSFVRLRALASGRCMAAGAPITVGQFTGFATSLVDDCSALGSGFQLMLAMTVQGAYQIRNGQTSDNLDVQMAGVADGTPVILFAPQLLENQRFFLRPRRARVFEIAPASVATSCVADVGTSTAIFACSSFDSAEEWELLPLTCG